MRKFVSILLIIVAAMAVVASPELRHDFGLVSGDGGVVSHRFWLRTEGNKSMAVTDVRTSCGCVVGAWDERMVSPEDSLYVDVRFDPSGRYGYQEKSVYVATTTGRYRLDMVARVVASDTTLRRYFPHRQGDVYLSVAMVEFGGVHPGESPVEMVEVYNAGSDTLRLRVEGPRWLKAHQWRDLLPPGESEPIALQALTTRLVADTLLCGTTRVDTLLCGTTRVDTLLCGTTPRAERSAIADTLRIAGVCLPVTLTLDSALATASGLTLSSGFTLSSGLTSLRHSGHYQAMESLDTVALAPALRSRPGGGPWALQGVALGSWPGGGTWALAPALRSWPGGGTWALPIPGSGSVFLLFSIVWLSSLKFSLLCV